MILKTILNGRKTGGNGQKDVKYPYSEKYGASLEYAKHIPITPHVVMDDTDAMRRELLRAARVLCTRLLACKKMILENATNETGSPITYHREDLDAALKFLRNLPNIKNLLLKNYHYEPKGNVLLIFSANEPILATTILVFTSLFVGNTTFVKPSSKTPSYAYWLIKELVKISPLKRKAHYLLTDQEEIERLIRARSFDFVFSFGSRVTSKKLAITCADSEIEFLQESEGNDWMYIDKAWNQVELASEIIAESFTRHNGQMCNAIRGVLVHRTVCNELISRLKDKLSSLPVDSPHLSASRIGALIEGTAERAAALVDNSSSKAKEIWNFSIEKNVITPTLILEPDVSSPIISESVFAPILWIKKVNDRDEVLSLYQEKNTHGLSFSVFSRDKIVLDDIVRHIEAGRININKHPLDVGIFDPLGGIKLSGHGGPCYWAEKLSNRKYVNRSRSRVI